LVPIAYFHFIFWGPDFHVLKPDFHHLRTPTQFTPRFKSVKRLKYPNVHGGERVRYYGVLLGGK
jgi:hypothetical protein